MSALKYLQKKSLKTFFKVVLDVSKNLYPDEYHQIQPQIFKLYTWVGYDVDGRGDIFGMIVLQKGLR